MATEYKIIKWRGGLKDDLIIGNLLPREGYICTDTGEFCFCYSAGMVKWYTSKEDIQALLGSSNEAYTALLQLINDLDEETILTSLLNTQNEINTARGNHPDLGGRLDELTTDIADNYQELTSHLADKANQADVDAINNRDHIIDQGTSGIWTYRKWNSGVAECWGAVSVTITSWTAWGSIYEGNISTSAIDYPFAFTSPPTEIATQKSTTTNWAWLIRGVANTATKSAVYNFARPTVGITGTFHVSLYVKGNWK